VSPHGPVEKLEENLWALASPVPGMPFPRLTKAITRRMVMVRLADGRIVFLDAVPMDDATLEEIRSWGTPSILVVTHGYHRIDIHAFQQKLGLKVLTPEKSAARVREIVAVDGHLDALPDDPALRAEPLVGRVTGEAVFISKAPSGNVTLLFSDCVMNYQQKLPLFARLMGAQGGPKVTPRFKKRPAADKQGLRTQLERLAQTPGLARLTMCHGDTVETNAPDALRAAAATI
jgi:hypothetical protein